MKINDMQNLYSEKYKTEEETKETLSNKNRDAS